MERFIFPLSRRGKHRGRGGALRYNNDGDEQSHLGLKFAIRELFLGLGILRDFGVDFFGG